MSPHCRSVPKGTSQALVAAICEHLKIPTKMVAAHREWAPTRKPDPHSLDMDKFREWVEEARAGGPAKAKPPPQQKANIIFEIGRVTVSQKKNELEPVDRRKGSRSGEMRHRIERYQTAVKLELPHGGLSTAVGFGLAT